MLKSIKEEDKKGEKQKEKSEKTKKNSGKRINTGSKEKKNENWGKLGKYSKNKILEEVASCRNK